LEIEMAEMTMIEDGEGKITWECSGCKEELKDKTGFGSKTKTCPKCGAEITQFHSLYDEDGQYAE
jgi:rRNA maturation endonuclease Nob1